METNQNPVSPVPAKPKIAPVAVIGDLIIDDFVEALPEPSIENPPATTLAAKIATTLAGGAALVARDVAEYSAGHAVYFLHPAPAVELPGSPRLKRYTVGCSSRHPRKLRVYSPEGNIRIDLDGGPVLAHREEPDSALDLTLPEATWSRGGCVVLADYRWMLADEFQTANDPLSEVFGATPSYLVIDPHRTRRAWDVGHILSRVPEETTVILKVSDHLWTGWLHEVYDHGYDAVYVLAYRDEGSLLAYLAECRDTRESGLTTYVWVTRGEKSGWLYNSSRPEAGPLELPVPEVPGKVVSAIGAGDTATAALAVGLASGLSVEDACRFGHAVATRKTRLKYTQSPTWEEVAQYYPMPDSATSGPSGDAESSPSGRVLRYSSLPAMGTLKPLHLAQDRELLEKCLRSALKTDSPPWARPGGPLVANGVFDGLHAGHQRVLTHCKQGREALIVGLNSDESLRKLGRTAHASCEDRARAIAQLRGVDLIVVYDDETPDALYDLVRQVTGGPITIVKGDEYAEQAAACPMSQLLVSWTASRGYGTKHRRIARSVPAVQVVTVPADGPQIGRTLQSVMRIWQAMQAGHVYPVPSSACRWCPYRQPCQNWRG